MKAFQILITACLLSCSFSLLKKDGVEETTSGGVIFDSNDFDDGDKMYFKLDIKENDFNSNNILYYYSDNIVGFSTAIYQVGYSKTSRYTENSIDYVSKYFTIKKKKSEYGTSTTGRYIYIFFPIGDGDWARIENTEEDGGKFPTWAIVVIIVVVVLIIAGIIIYCCYRRKKRMQAMAQPNVATVAVVGTQQNFQTQAYQAQVNQAQAQAYKAQMNAVQTYPQQNYQTPINYNDAGYSSKGAM